VVQPGFSQATGAPARGMRGGFSNFHQPRPFNDRVLVLGSPYLYDYADYLPPVPAQPAPEVVMVPGAPSAVPQPTPPQSLLLERQGDRWVRVSLSDFSVEGATQAGHSQAPSGRVPGEKMLKSAAELPPAVLIFADGRKEEVSRYTIIGKVLYANADYWTTGSWTKKIFLSSLNLPATLQANQERGVNFILPSGPNEVVMRP